MEVGKNDIECNGLAWGQGGKRMWEWSLGLVDCCGGAVEVDEVNGCFLQL